MHKIFLNFSIFLLLSANNSDFNLQVKMELQILRFKLGKILDASEEAENRFFQALQDEEAYAKKFDDFYSEVEHKVICAEDILDQALR